MKIETSVVPWALPNEEIPIRIIWPKSLVFDEIRVILPEGFRCTDVLNAKQSRIWKNQVSIKQFIGGSIGDSNFIGIVVKSKVIQEKIDEVNQITARFVQDGVVLNTIAIGARTLRPKLELLKAPERLEISSQEQRLKIPLELRYLGFGDIRVNLLATFRGQIISQGESLIYEVMRRLSRDKGGSRPKHKRPTAEVDSSLVGSVSREIIARLEKGNISFEQIDMEAISYLRDWLSEIGPEKIGEVLYARVEDLLVGVLTDLVSRNPISGVQLDEPRTKLVTKIQFPINELTLNIKYRDLIGNRYPPIPINITIAYKDAVEKPLTIDIPVTITKWQHKPIMNVGDLR